MTFKTFYSEAEVEVSLEEWTTEELIEELKVREAEIEQTDVASLLSKIYYARKSGRDFNQDLDDLIYTKLGRI